MIGPALVALFAALALSGALARASMARSHRDAGGFALWLGVAGAVVVIAVVAIAFRGTWADLYDRLSSFMSSK
jgi:hypothetical protein